MNTASNEAQTSPKLQHSTKTVTVRSLSVLLLVWLVSGGVVIEHGYEWSVSTPSNALHSKSLSGLIEGEVLVFASEPHCTQRIMSIPFLFRYATVNSPCTIEVGINASLDETANEFVVEAVLHRSENGEITDLSQNADPIRGDMYHIREIFPDMIDASIWKGGFDIVDATKKNEVQEIDCSGTIRSEDGIELARFSRTIILVPRYRFRILPGWIQWLYYDLF